MKKIVLVMFDAGGGHRSAATALEMVIQRQERPWTVELLNLQETLDPIDPLLKIFSLRVQDVYNQILANNWTLGSRHLLKVLQGAIRAGHRRELRLLEPQWARMEPDLVVSLIPHFNRALFESLALARPGVPFVTVLTDLADYPPHFWIEQQPQFFICGSERAVEQARSMGHPAERIFRASGMILHPRFYESVEVDRDSERRRLGLEPELPAAIVLFGGAGSSEMPGIAERLGRSQSKTQLMMICGRNEPLAQALRQSKPGIPMFVEGFTQRVPYYMRLADFFIGKPGPGSVSEAIAMDLPVIVESNAWTLPQERYNAEWVREKQAGIVLHGFKEIVPAVREMIQPDNLARYRQHAAAIQNRAVFEIPDMLAQILDRPAR
ncbi:MAG: glycosyltransferase [Terriglobia bacterium]